MKTRMLLMISFIFLLWPQGIFAKTSPEVQQMVRESNARADIIQSVQNSVVHIQVEKIVNGPGAGAYNNPFELFNDDFLNRFFHGRNGQQAHPGQPQQYKQEGLGTGSIIDTDGHILTNNHVVGGADKITVQLLDGREFPAKVVGTDPLTDIAVVKIDAKNLKPIPMGNSDKLRIGETVIAIGNPFGLNHTVTMGIVSAKGRSNMDIADYEDFIQTDAAINPGNSGGPLINLKGEMIGINTAIFTRSGGYQGIGFSVPVNMARQVMKQLIEKGQVTRGWLGILLQDISPDLAKALNLDNSNGALVSEVSKGSPAEKAGLERGDVIVKFGSKTIKNADQLKNEVGLSDPGRRAEMVVIRKGSKKHLMVKLGTRPVNGPKVAPQPGSPGSIGLTAQPITPELAKQYGLTRYNSGVIITSVMPNSPAYSVGLQPGMLVMEINHKTIKTMADFNGAMKAANFKEGVLMLIGTPRGASYVILKINM